MEPATAAWRTSVALASKLFNPRRDAAPATRLRRFTGVSVAPAATSHSASSCWATSFTKPRCAAGCCVRTMAAASASSEPAQRLSDETSTIRQYASAIPARRLRGLRQYAQRRLGVISPWRRCVYKRADPAFNFTVSAARCALLLLSNASPEEATLSLLRVAYQRHCPAASA